MLKLSFLILSFFLIFLDACSGTANNDCHSTESQTDNRAVRELTKPPIHVHISNFTSAELCNRLISIDTLPTHDPNITDPIYESLIAKGDDAISCLVEKISDETPVPDPRYSVPRWQHYAVGDTAVFTLVDILRKNEIEREKLLIEMLPSKYREEWKTNGVYAYFNYVSEPRNRKELQRWWRKWVKENKK